MSYSETRYDDITPALGAYYADTDVYQYTNTSAYVNYARYVQRYNKSTADGDYDRTEDYLESGLTGAYGLACFEYTNYFNCHDKAGKWTNTGAAGVPSISWATPNLISGENLTDTVAKIKETRDKIGVLDQSKWRPDASTPSLANASDSTFNDNDSGTPEQVNSSQYETLRSALQLLYASFTFDLSKTDLEDDFTSILPEPIGSEVNASDINLLRVAITQIANSCYEAYANYLNYSAAASTNNYNYADANLRVVGYVNTCADYSNYKRCSDCTDYTEYTECADYTKYNKCSDTPYYDYKKTYTKEYYKDLYQT